MSAIEGQVAIVTGGARGIGLCTVRLLLQAKAKVQLAYLDIVFKLYVHVHVYLGDCY